MTIDTTSNISSSLLPTTTVLPTDSEEFIVRATKIYSDLANSVNSKVIGLYDSEETLTGKIWFDPQNSQNYRDVFRKVFTVPFPVANITHGISDFLSCTDISGTFDTVLGFISVNYASPLLVTDQIGVVVTPAQIIITPGATAPVINGGFIVLEYLKE